MIAGYGYQALTDAQRAFYDGKTADAGRRRVVMDRYVEKEIGGAFPVASGHVLRITCCDGPQVCDFNAFSADDPAEHFWSGRTRTLQGAHLSVGDRLWSTEPKMRPMFTIIADTVEHAALPNNAASHDLIYARCSTKLWQLRNGSPNPPNCNTNMMRALTEIGFPATYVHDAFNIFMTTGFDEQHRLFFLEPEAKQGDYIELYAEIDTMVAISCCPGGCSGPINKGLQFTVFESMD